jgi:hypothetical protein
MPYSLPDASFLISSVPPAWTQETEAGFAIPTAVWVAAGDVVPAGFAVCCVHPAIRIAEMTTNERIRSVLFFIIVSPQ